MFKYISRNEGEKKLHISHLHKYVSAYFDTKEGVESLVEDIEEALERAMVTGQAQIVDQDGEMCFHVYSTGMLTLMVPWKRYRIIREGEEE